MSLFLDDDTEYKFAFDPDRMQVGCVIVQAGYGGDTAVCQEFDTKDWVVHPTDAMIGVRMKGSEIKKLAAACAALRKGEHAATGG